MRMIRKLFSKLYRSKSNRSTFIRFAAVGGIISLVDAGGLYLLIESGFSAYLSRIPSYAAAMVVGYVLNRCFTFHHRGTGRAFWHSLLRHFSVHSIGGMINYGVFLLVLIIGQKIAGGEVSSFLLPLIAIWWGGFVCLCFNYFFSKRMVFDH